jgi:ribosomal protein S12 methylthiotransferase accessory factor
MPPNLDEIGTYFDVLDLAPDDWPVRLVIAAPGAAAQARWPGLPATASPAAGRAGNGRGLTAAAAAASGLGEALEIACSVAWDDEPFCRAREADLGPEAWGLAGLAGFSPAQLEDRTAWNLRLAGTDRVPLLPEADRPIDWLAACDAFSGTEIWLPADAVLIGRSAGDGAGFPADTNGVAAGPSPEAARLAALLELVERDAAGRWWYGRRLRPAVDPGDLPNAGPVLDHLARRGRRALLLDITSDLGIPVAAAFAADARDGAHVSVGFAARPTLFAAAADALCELMQMEFLVHAARMIGAARPGLSRWFAEARAGSPPLAAAPGPALPPEDGGVAGPGPALAAALACLAACGCRVAFLDRTRPEFGLPVWRAVAPTLCHWKPRLGRARLLAPDPRDAAPVATEPNPVILRI